MADLASTDITYTLQHESMAGAMGKRSVYKLAFGDGALTYPSGGLPLLKAKVGCPNVIKVAHILDSDDALGNVYKYDYANNKIKAYLSPARTHAHDLKVIGSQAAASTDAVSAKVATLGKESATNLTIAKADSATLGGVISETLAAAALTEFSSGSTAIAATVMYMEFIGY